MYGNAKNMANYLAVSEEVANIALPKSRCHTENTYFCRNTANFLSGVISFDDGTLASFREGFASFVTYITKIKPIKIKDCDDIFFMIGRKINVEVKVKEQCGKYQLYILSNNAFKRFEKMIS